MPSTINSNSSEPPAQSGRWLPVFWCVASLLVAAGFTSYTGQVWEDFFITFKFSQNLAEGHGLTYDGEEPLHGFTSVINTLAPALFYALGGDGDWRDGLFGYRVLSWLALTAGVGFLLYRLWKTPGELRLAVGFFAGFLLLDIKSMAYAYNGQEAAFMLGFLALALAALHRGMGANWRILGMAWAGLLYTRPDSPVYIAALTLAGLAFPPAGRQRLQEVPGILKAAALAAVLYLPWFLAAWVIFGSPVPHTIVAKASGGMLGNVQLGSLANTVLRVLSPIYYNPADWPAWVGIYSSAAGLLAAAYWALPVRDRMGRIASLCFFLVLPYFIFLDFARTQFPWYFPPMAFFALFVLARALFGPVRRLLGRWPVLIAALILIALMGHLFARGLYQIKYQQIYSEGVRTATGLWLREHVEPGEAVYLECLGYIGFFSRAKMLDWPGMASPEVVAAARIAGPGFYDILEYLEPKWVALRQHEFQYARERTSIGETHTPRILISRRAEILQHRPPRWIAYEEKIPGIGYLLMDAAFVVLERKPEMKTSP